MAAALLTRDPGLRCLHRELCRIVWRKHTAALSSKPTDKKPRRTHFKKAKPEPPVEIKELVEKIFSQKRPDAAKLARSAKSPSKPLTTSSVKRSNSDVPPLSHIKPSGIAFTSSSTPKQSQGGNKRAALFTAQSFFQPETTNPQISKNPSDVDLQSASAPSSSSSPAAADEPVLSRQDLNLTAGVAPHERPTTETTDGLSSHSDREALVRETTVASTVGDHSSPKEPLDTPSHAAKEEPPIETPVASPFKVGVDHEHRNDPGEATDVSPVSLSAKQEASAESREELKPLECSILVENPSVLDGGPVVPTLHHAGQGEETNTTGSGTVRTSNNSEEQPKTNSQPELESSALFGGPEVEPSASIQVQAQIEDVLSPEGTLETVPEAKEAQTSFSSLMTKPASEALEDHSPPVGSVRATHAEEEHSHKDLTQAEDVEEKVKEPQKLTLESVTLHSVTSSVESLQSDELHQTKSILDEQASRVQETECRAAAESEGESEGEGEPITETLSKWESLSEDLEGLEGEGGTLVNELLSSIPALVSKGPDQSNTSSACDPPEAVIQDPRTHDEDVAMTLESMTLADVKAEVGRLDGEVLHDTFKSLEREFEEFEREEKPEGKSLEEVIDQFEDTLEAEISNMSISEATDAIEAETDIMMEAMFGSEQGMKQPTKDSLQEPRLEEGAGRDAPDGGEGVVEAMSLESVTLAEVEASLGAIEDDSLTETADYLEKESEALAEGRGAGLEEGAATDKTTQHLSFDLLAAPEAEGLPEEVETDALVEELLFTVPGLTATDGRDETDNGPEGTRGGEEPAEVHTDLDPVQSLFLEKIRQYANVSRGMSDAEPEFLKRVSEETAKLQKLHGGGDLSSFPQFSFSEPDLDQELK